MKEVVYKDSAVLISVTNPDKSGTEAYFDKKYKLNGYDNINMVGIYQYNSAKPLQSASLEDAIMAKVMVFLIECRMGEPVRQV